MPRDGIDLPPPGIVNDVIGGLELHDALSLITRHIPANIHESESGAEPSALEKLGSEVPAPVVAI